MTQIGTNIPETAVPANVSEKSGSQSIDWIKILSVLWSSRRLIALVTGIVTVGAVFVSFLLPEYYRSTATLLPETEKSKLAALGGLSDLAALAGVNVGGDASLAKLYPTILKSETVLKNVLYAQYQTKRFKEPVNLIKFWDVKENTPERSYEVALKELRDELQVSLDSKTSVVTIAIETREPSLSADILNTLTKELDLFIRTKRTTNASEQRKWIDARLEEVKKDLQNSENRLKEFREKNRRVTDSPRLQLEQGRLMREVEINSTLYIELKKQYEIAKIEEIKNIPIINVMDEARPAARKEKPKRGLIVLTCFFLGVGGVFGFVLLAHRYSRDVQEALARLKGEIVTGGKGKDERSGGDQ